MYEGSEISHNTKETSFIRTVSRTFEHELVPGIILSMKVVVALKWQENFECAHWPYQPQQKTIHPHEEEAKTKMRMPVDILKGGMHVTQETSNAFELYPRCFCHQRVCK